MSDLPQSNPQPRHTDPPQPASPWVQTSLLPLQLQAALTAIARRIYDTGLGQERRLAKSEVPPALRDLEGMAASLRYFQSLCDGLAATRGAPTEPRCADLAATFSPKLAALSSELEAGLGPLAWELAPPEERWLGQSKPVARSLDTLERLGVLVKVSGSTLGGRGGLLPFSTEIRSTPLTEGTLPPEEPWEEEDPTAPVRRATFFVCRPSELHRVAREAARRAAEQTH